MASAVVLECTAVSGMMLMRAGQQSRVFATSSTTTTSSKQKMDLRCIQQQSLLSKLSLSNGEMIPVVWRRTDSRTRAVVTSASSASSSSSPVAVASGAPSGLDAGIQQNLKRAVAKKAVELVKSGMIVGLGTGSTSSMAIEELGKLIAQNKVQSTQFYSFLVAYKILPQLDLLGNSQGFVEIEDGVKAPPPIEFCSKNATNKV
jgi:hypothetical protein